jgi:uncharacterized protein
LAYNDNLIDQVVYIVDNLSYRKEIEMIQSGTTANFPLELRIVQDADRLDAIGAVGIVRCFSFGAARNRPIYDAEVAPIADMTRADYDNLLKQNKSVSLNHFEEKLFKIKGLMKTDLGKQMAEERHEFMVRFVQQFKKEAFLSD